MYSNPIMEKSFNFAVDIIEFYKSLVSEKREFILSKQLLRSGTSIGANVKEGIKAISKADFRYKMSIALKEANETEYWIELLIKSGIVDEDDVKSINYKVRELCRVLEAIVKTSGKNMESSQHLK